MANIKQQHSSWWGDYSIPIDQTDCWDIGPLTLFICHLDNEWNITYQRDPENENIDNWQYKQQVQIQEEEFEHKRYVFSSTSDTLTLKPLLADRPVVIRPETPFHVPAGQETTLFVSTPLWLELQVHAPPVKLMEMPIIRPSDTWFGPSTMEGELCYASRTHGRLSLQNFPFLPHRAITPVMIRNNTKSGFQLERLNLTVTYLSLYGSSEQYLWTEGVTMVLEPDLTAASIKIGEGAPEQAQNAMVISEPRMKVDSRSFISKISTLFE
jgi:hypothetical protein